MKIKDGLFLCKVGENSVVLAGGNADMQIKGLTTLNATGAFIWEQFREDTDTATVVEAMMREYDVDRETAEADVREFTQLLQKSGFMEGE